MQFCPVGFPIFLCRFLCQPLPCAGQQPRFCRHFWSPALLPAPCCSLLCPQPLRCCPWCRRRSPAGSAGCRQWSRAQLLLGNQQPHIRNVPFYSELPKLTALKGTVVLSGSYSFCSFFLKKKVFQPSFAFSSVLFPHICPTKAGSVTRLGAEPSYPHLLRASMLASLNFALSGRKPQTVPTSLRLCCLCSSLSSSPLWGKGPRPIPAGQQGR